MTKEMFRYVLRDRVMAVILALLVLFMLVAAVLLFFWIRPSDIQIPIRYSGFDSSLFNDRWYERLTFPVFLFFQTVTSGIIAMLLHARGYRIISYFLVSTSYFATALTLVVAFAVTRTVTL